MFALIWADSSEVTVTSQVTVTLPTIDSDERVM